jgi:hypothetical protein
MENCGGRCGYGLRSCRLTIRTEVVLRVFAHLKVNNQSEGLLRSGGNVPKKH